jgi:hypothetical protein
LSDAPALEVTWLCPLTLIGFLQVECSANLGMIDGRKA